MNNTPNFGYGDLMVEYMEWIREDLVLGAGAYAETEIPMPVGRSENIICAIHEIQFQMAFTTVADALDAAGDRLEFHLSKKTKAAVEEISDPDVIDNFLMLCTHLGTNGQWNVVVSPIVHHFYPPIMIAYSKLYFGGYSTDAGTAHIRIGYTLRKVSKQELYDALVD